MILEIEKFLKIFFQDELDAHNAEFHPDLENLNNKAKKMYSSCSKELFGKLSILLRDELEVPSFYEEYKEYRFKYPRFLFKISHYNHPKYNDLFLAYVSDAAKNYNKYNSYGDCFFISKFEGGYKIFSLCFNSSFDGFKWKCGIGVEDVSIKTAGKLIEIKRYLEPNPKKDKLLKLNLKEHYRDR